jgi:hypothetical protein
MNEAQNTNTLINQLLNGDAQLSDEQHDAFLTKDRSLYAALLRLPNLSAKTAMAIIQRLLAVTEITVGLAVSKSQKEQEDRLILELLPHLPVSSVLQGFLKLVERRVNNQRTSGWIRAYIFGAPQLESYAVTYRQTLRKLIRHALGAPVTQTCLHKFALEKPDKKTTAYLQRYVLRYAKDAALVQEVFLFLFGKLEQSQFSLLNAYLEARYDIEAGKGLPFKVLRGIAGTFHQPDISQRHLRRLAGREKLKRDVTEEVDGSLVGKIRNYYHSATDISHLNAAIEAEATQITAWDANVYFIVDASASMRGFGHREYNNIAIAMGLLKVFQKRIRETEIGWIGATPNDNNAFPQPVGTTALAPALIKAFQAEPDLIILISDGYENVEQGDTAMVLAEFEKLGIKIPILHIIPAFTERENIADRQPLVGSPTFLETGQRGFLSTWLRIRAHLEPESLSMLLRQTLS